MPKRILLVEDEDNNIALMRDVLTLMLGQEVIVATDGTDAIRMAQTHQPDLILMDLNIPKLDGWQATRSLRAMEAFRDTPILALSAHTMVGDRERALEAGCDDHFPKPVDIDAFIAFLQPYLRDEEEGEQTT